MAGITLAQAEAQLTAWLAASINVAAGQAVSMGGKSLTMVDSTKIQQQIDYWQSKVDVLSGGTDYRRGPSIMGGTPV
jgi:hypothetical protein